MCPHAVLPCARSSGRTASPAARRPACRPVGAAFEQEWAADLEDSRRTFSLGGLYAVLQDWQGRIAHAPAVDALAASGYDDSDAVDMAELRGRRQRR
ncbi:DUF6247 family protein [Streptomyces rubiginosohelvolus]